MKKYSIIVPVYNRPNEINELLRSLEGQTFKNFEILIIEDGSTKDCSDVVQQYSTLLDIKYYRKNNTGPGDSRNFGMKRSSGQYLIFFDSDCIIPINYFEKVDHELSSRLLDAYGGPDNADSSFTKIQKAINYSMTSIITTGGIRGKENKLDNYQPRSFNMGIKRIVYESIGGFSDIHPGEDPDFSYRIMKADFNVGLIKDAFVYHKRRVNFLKFIKQVYKFGVVRAILIKWYPDRFKLTYILPTLFLLISIIIIILSISISVFFILPLLFIFLTIIIDSLIKTKSLTICILSVVASFIQLYVYSYGFLISAIKVLMLRQNEREAFKGFFFTKS